jgi:hypothetical protein
MASRSFLLATLLAATPLSAVTNPRLSYDGFDVDSTAETAKQRYPNSNFTGISFVVTSSDSRGLVRYVAFQEGRVLLGLGSNAVDDAIKPLCFTVYKRLAKTFGKPNLVQSNLLRGPIKMRIYLIGPHLAQPNFGLERSVRAFRECLARPAQRGR